MSSFKPSDVSVHGSNRSLLSSHVDALPNRASANLLYDKLQLYVDVHLDWFTEEQLSAFRTLQEENGTELPSLMYVAGLCVCLGITINALESM